MGNRKRNTALVLIAAGLFLLVQQHAGFLTLAALLLIVLGLYKARTEPGRSGYWLLGIGGLLLLSGHLTLVLSVLLISLGFFFMRTKQMHQNGEYIRKHRFVESSKWNREPWILKSMSLWHLIGEIHLDLTLAIPEQPETTIVIQGIIGDVDILVPDYLGVSISASAFCGQLDVRQRKEAGILNKVVWQSPNYGLTPQSVRIELAYVVADIDVKVV